MSVTRPVESLLLYAEDFRGVGHINRTLTVARHVLAKREQLTAVVVTGSRVPDIFVLPPRCDFIKLPPRRPWAASGQTQEETEAARQTFGESYQQIQKRYSSLRQRLLLETALGLAPSIVVVDNEPLGFEEEFREGLYALKDQHPSTRFIYMMLDIVGDEEFTRRRWQDRGVYEALDNLYDDIIVTGSREILDVSRAYALPTRVQSKVRYSGYIVRDLTTDDKVVVRQRYGLSPASPVVVVTVGAGHVGYPVMKASLEALRLLRVKHPNLEAVLVTGPLMKTEQYEELKTQAGSLDQVLRQTDNFQLMVAADAVVTMSGLSSVSEALSLARPMVLTPQAPIGKRMKEQLLRAQLLSELGLAMSVPISRISGAALAEGMRWALSYDPAAYVTRLGELRLQFDGARWIGDHLLKLLEGSRGAA